MFSYRHHYHAGSVADVFKHAILVALIRALRRKDKPFFVLDTHAGIGRYDLRGYPARKTAEFEAGIGRLWNATASGPELADYLGVVRAANRRGAGLDWYPGSPRIVRALLREADRLVLSELNPADHALLKAEFAGDRQVAVHHLNGYAALKAFLPPRERRGLVFLDPPFEQAGEFQHLLDGLRLIYRRWPTAIAAIWYPIIERTPSARFHRDLDGSGIPAVLCVELGIYPFDVPRRLNGCGMLVINPPWQLDETLGRLLQELLHWVKSDLHGQTRIEWLRHEPINPA